MMVVPLPLPLPPPLLLLLLLVLDTTISSYGRLSHLLLGALTPAWASRILALFLAASAAAAAAASADAAGTAHCVLYRQKSLVSCRPEFKTLLEDLALPFVCRHRRRRRHCTGSRTNQIRRPPRSPSPATLSACPLVCWSAGLPPGPPATDDAEVSSASSLLCIHSGEQPTSTTTTQPPHIGHGQRH